MKRAISFLATVMFACVVAFGFVVNTASASPRNTVDCPAEITALSPCSVRVSPGDLVVVAYAPGIKLGVSINNPNQNEAAVLPTIGNLTKDPLVIPSLKDKTISYDTGESFVSTFENKSTTTNTVVYMRITKAS